MVRRFPKKIKIKLNFLWKQSNYLNYQSRKLLYNALIQPYFNYRCTSWYSFLSKALKNKLQITLNSYIRFCLELRPLGYLSPSHFREVNWHPVGTAPSYTNDMFLDSPNNYNTISQITLNTTLQNNEMTKHQRSGIS